MGKKNKRAAGARQKAAKSDTKLAPLATQLLKNTQELKAAITAEHVGKAENPKATQAAAWLAEAEKWLAKAAQLLTEAGV